MNGLFGPESPDWRQALPQMAQIQQKPPQMRPQGGMFGRRGGIDIGQLGAMLLAANGNPLGQMALQHRQQQIQSRDEMKQRHLQREQDLSDRMTFWRQQQEYERANPAPSEFDRQLRAAGITDPAEVQAAYRDVVMNRREGSPYQFDVNQDGLPDIVPRAEYRRMIAGGAPSEIPTVATPEEARRLPPGTEFRTPDGRVRRVPGGAGSQAQAPFSANRLDTITAEGESGNRDFANGRPVTSSAGARFAMQVMPETARDPGFGLRPANPNDPRDMNRLGREYRRVMEQRYGGDLAKMWAAYNWGPGNLDRAINRLGDNWLQAAPPETRDYIRRNLGALRGP